MNLTRALRPVVTLLLSVALVPACGEDPPADAIATTEAPDTTGAADSRGTTGDAPTGDAPTGASTDTTGPDATSTGATDPDATSTGATATSGPGGASSGDDSTGSGTGGGEPGVLGTPQEGCFVNGGLSPSLPQEAGYLGATVLTPDTYPFAVSRVQYTLRRELEVDCINTYAHRVEIFVTEGGTPPAMPSLDASTFVSIAVEESLDDVALRVLEPVLDPPIVLTDGQSLVVAVSLEADPDAGLALCLESCVGDPVAGVDFWSNAAAEPYEWADLVGDYGFPSNFKIYAFGAAP